MPKNELTQHLLAESFKHLVDTTPPDKISIKQITDAAGLNRQTFYYHFQDKQELISWIFDTDIAELKDKRDDGSLLDDFIEYLHAEKSFYVAALSSNAQNCLREHMFFVFQKRLSQELVTIARDYSINDTDLRYISRFYAHGLTGSLVQWAKTGMNYEYVSFSIVHAPYLRNLLAYTINLYTT